MEEQIVGARRVVATAGVLGGSFLAAIETTVVAAAMPTVADQLGGLSAAPWWDAPCERSWDSSDVRRAPPACRTGGAGWSRSSSGSGGR